MQTYEGYWENGNFFPMMQTAHTSERRRAFLTVLDEPAKPSKRDNNRAWLERFHHLLAESSHEDDLLLDEAFTRRASGRELVVFDGEDA